MRVSNDDEGQAAECLNASSKSVWVRGDCKVGGTTKRIL